MQSGETIRDRFGESNGYRVQVIFDVWEKRGSKNRRQLRTKYMDIEDVVQKYGDFIYGGWHIEGWWKDGKVKAILWANPTGDAAYMNHWRVHSK